MIIADVAYLVAFVLIATLVEGQLFGWSTIVVIAMCVLAQCVHWVNFLSLVAHPWRSLAVFAGYLVVGVLWSFVRWGMLLVSFRRFRQLWNEADINKRRNLGSRYRGLSVYDKVRASDMKRTIIAWITYWPFSLVGTIFDDPVRRLVVWIFETLSSTYQRMADKIIPEIKVEDKHPEPELPGVSPFLGKILVEIVGKSFLKCQGMQEHGHLESDEYWEMADAIIHRYADFYGYTVERTKAQD